MSSFTRAWRWRTSGVVVPAGGALLLFATFYATTTTLVLQRTEGHLTYGLDDAYIHMAIAKNLATHGVWGVHAGTFSASSSSPLWTALLGASFKIVGVHEIIPLLLNTAFAVACLVALAFMLKREQIPAPSMFAIIAAVVLFTPMVPMVWSGMEHTLQILLTLIAAWSCHDLVRRYSARRVAAFSAVVALMVATRYEGLFVVAGCAVVLMMRRRGVAAVAALAAGALPVVCVGVWNVSHGWFFLPASILMKQTVLAQPHGTGWLESLIANVAQSNAPAEFLALLAVSVALGAYRGYASRSFNIEPLLTIFIVASLLHLSLAKFGWLYRYEAYLMALGAFAVGTVTLGARPIKADPPPAAVAHADVVLVGALLAALAADGRTIISNLVVANTAGHIYRQQRQMARFIDRYYSTEPVALNDIGVVSYFTNARVDDLKGLGSLEPGTMRREGSLDADHINAWLERDGVGVDIVYDGWFEGALAVQRKWFRVVAWKTGPVAAPDDSVTFYARSASDAHRLLGHLRDFSAALPASVDIRLEDAPTR
jgi:hypothetical protein